MTIGAGMSAGPLTSPVLARPTWVVIGLVSGGAAALGAAGALLLVLLLGNGSGTGPGPVGDTQPLAVGSVVDETGAATFGESVADQVTSIVVDVAGGVAEPGLRRLRTGDRVGDAIAAAGGFAPRADLVQAASGLNLAEPLSDGMKVFVPLLGVAQGGPESAGGDGLIDINGADQALLESLPGVGPVTATRIIEARAESRFASVEDLLSREVVGNAVFEGLRDLVRAG